jgi:hypothetical protein
MNRMSIACLVMLALGTAANAEDSAAKRVLLPIELNNSQWGYIDDTGAPASIARYLGAMSFHESLAAVSDARNLWGYIDSSERLVVPPRFQEAKSFSDGLAAVRLEKDGKWGYIDTSGKMVIPAQYVLAYDFHEGFAYVYTGTVAELIDKTGHALDIPSPWRVSDGFSEGFAAVLSEGQAGFIDRSGKIAITLPVASYAVGFSEGLAGFSAGSKYGYIDKSGAIVIPATFDGGSAFHEKRAAVWIGKKWGFIDPKGKLVIAAEYDHAGDFSQGLAPVGQGGTSFLGVTAWRYIDGDGKTIIPPAYSYAEPFTDGFAQVAIGEVFGDNLYFYIDRTGRPPARLSFIATDAKADFSAAKNEFNLNSSGAWNTSGGAYTFTSDGKGWSFRRTTRFACPDFYAEVKVLSMTGEDAMAGIVFKTNAANDTFYLFGLQKDGLCGVQFKGKDKDWMVVDSGSVSGKPGANTLQVAVRGDTVDCFLNGARAVSFRDTRVGELYRYVGLYASSATAASFDDLAVRAIGREERLAALDVAPTPLEAYRTLDVQTQGFPDSSLRLFAPPDPTYPGELYLGFGGLGTGGYRMREITNKWDELEFVFVGQPLYKDIGSFGLQFPKEIPKDDSGNAKYLDISAWSPKFFLSQVASFGSLRGADLAAARTSSPKAIGAIDLAIFLTDWRASSLEAAAKKQEIWQKNRWVPFEDIPGIAVDLVDVGGILSALWGLIDWGISGSFGQRQSLEVWGGLGAMAAANLLYLPYGFLIAEPIADGIIERKTREMQKEMDVQFRVLADAMQAKYPQAMIDGRPEGVTTK